MLGKPESQMQKNEAGPQSYTIHKNQLKPRKKKKIGSKHLDTGHGNDFFRFDNKSKGNKSKNKKEGLYKLKSSCTAMETSKKETYKMEENICKSFI